MQTLQFADVQTQNHPTYKRARTCMLFSLQYSLIAMLQCMFAQTKQLSLVGKGDLFLTYS